MGYFFSLLIVFLPAYVLPLAMFDKIGQPDMVTASFFAPFIIAFAFFLLKPIRAADGESQAAVVFFLSPLLYSGTVFLVLSYLY